MVKTTLPTKRRQMVHAAAKGLVKDEGGIFMSDETKGLSYADAGVDIDAGQALVDRIKPAAKRTSRPGVVDGLGGFGALFDLKSAGYFDPILVSATDGVGTKLRMAIEADHLRTIGTDLVAMCVNDLICQGAEPLFFLDYFATGQLDVMQASRVIQGIARACEEAGCALIGGETAEMPGMYSDDDFDLAGFAVGAMERGNGLPHDVKEGDILLGLSSSGVHSNGYSLVRKVIERTRVELDEPAPWNKVQTFGAAFLTPTRLYVRAVMAAIRTGGVHAAAHITGGGLTDNVPRVLPEGLGAEINLDSWGLPGVFGWLAVKGHISEEDMLRTFNCGIGMVLVVDPSRAESLVRVMAGAGERITLLGRVCEGEGVSYTGNLS